MQISRKIVSPISDLIKRSMLSDQSPVRKKKKGHADGTAMCIIHVGRYNHRVLEFIIKMICSVLLLFKLHILYVFIKTIYNI